MVNWLSNCIKYLHKVLDYVLYLIAAKKVSLKQIKVFYKNNLETSKNQTITRKTMPISGQIICFQILYIDYGDTIAIE